MISKNLKVFSMITISLIVIASLVLSFADVQILIKIDNRAVDSDVLPQLIQNRTMVPIRVITEAMGADVEWNQEEMVVEITSPYQKFINHYVQNDMYIKQVDELLTMFIEGELTVLDVRSEELRAKGYIDGSIHIPLPQLLDRLNELPKDKMIAVYCSSNINASYAVTILNMLDYEAYVLEDGMNSWVTAGGKNSYFST